MEANKELCFVISPIGEKGTITRENSDKVFKHIISPTVQEFGYEAIRADQLDKPGIITSQIIQYLKDVPLVIADLSERNPNVFYEMAIRHAVRLPIIQIIDKNDNIPFDVSQTRTVKFDLKDLDSVEEARKEIKKQIENIRKEGFEIDNPITAALEIKTFRESNKPADKLYGELLEIISDLRINIFSIDKKLSDPINLFPFELIERTLRHSPRNPLSKQMVADITFCVLEIQQLITLIQINESQTSLNMHDIKNRTISNNHIIDSLHQVHYKLNKIVERTEFYKGIA